MPLMIYLGWGGHPIFVHNNSFGLVYISVHTKIDVPSLPRTFSKVFGGWWVVVLKATLVFSFGPNWNLSLDLNQAEQLLPNYSYHSSYIAPWGKMPLL